MRSKYSVKLKTIVEEHHLTPLHTSKDYESAQLITADVNRPALQLAGFYNYFDPHRLQMIGHVESTYLSTLSSAERLRAYERFRDAMGLRERLRFTLTRILRGLGDFEAIP